MAETDIIMRSLEQAGTLCPDPGPSVYARLFELHPEFEALFVLDDTGGVRDSMLETSLTCLIGVAEGDETQTLQLAANRSHHEGYGVDGDAFDVMFTAMRDVFRKVLGPEWTPTHERAWAGLLDELAAIR